MASLNMASINTLFRKGYFLAGVIIAANIFIVNKMKAMEKKLNYEEDKDINEKKEEKSVVRIFLDNFYKADIVMFSVGGLVSSVANNYFKWWNYNAGTYHEFGCVGWRSKRLLNDILQFEGNFNLGRGISWSIRLFLICYALPKWRKNDEAFFPLLLAIRGFLSAPLTLHFSKFSISISLDAILWGVINILIYLKNKKEEEEWRKKIIELEEK